MDFNSYEGTKENPSFLEHKKLMCCEAFVFNLVVVVLIKLPYEDCVWDKFEPICYGYKPVKKYNRSKN